MKRNPVIFIALLLVSQFAVAQTNPWTISGNNIYNTLPGYVGIGTSPAFPLDVAGMIHTSYALMVDQATTGIGGWFRGPANTSSNLVVHGSQGNWIAWWLTGSQGYMKFGNGGGNETWVGAINIDQANHVGINTQNTSGYTFNVNGTAVFDGVTVKNFSGNKPNATPWADYVFAKEFQLPSLASIEDYIKANHHLPGIPTSAEVAEKGLDLGANQARLLEKIEELTLYTIELQKQVDQLKNQIGKQGK
jgi:hypothetical protein